MEGPERRHGLEEVKPATCGIPTFTSFPRKSGFSDPSRALEVGYQQQTTVEHATPDNRLLVRPRSSGVLDSQLISNFWDKYIPDNAPSQGSVSQCVWLQQAIGLPNPSEALRLSLKALVMTRLGFESNDESLFRQGHVNYVGALQSVQRDISREDLVMRDNLFVAGYILAVYEVCHAC